MATAASASRKLIKAPGVAVGAAASLGFGPGSAAGGDDALPWDVVEQKLAELLRFVASAVQAVVAALGSLVRVAVPVAAAVAVLLVVCCCCCCCCVAAAQRQRRGPDGEEVDGGLGGDGDGPVVTYRRGVYKGGIFSMHPNKPIVC